jgi:hypothetical protein
MIYHRRNAPDRDSVVSAGPMARSTGVTPIVPLWLTVLLRWPLDRSGIPAQFPRGLSLSVLRGDGWLSRGCAAGPGWPGRSGLLLSAFPVPWMAGVAESFGPEEREGVDVWGRTASNAPSGV